MPFPKSTAPHGNREAGLASTAPALVTLIAINAVVDVAVHALMFLVGRRLGMTIRALEDCVVAGIGVAGCTDPSRATVVGVEPGMVEGCACPSGDHLVAGLARRWESSRYVVRIVRGLVLGFVARVAIGWQRGVVVVHMAVRARDFGVRAHQRENCVVVVERGRLPRGSAVAHIALLRESSGNVIRIGSALIVGHVATDTRRTGQVVVSVLVAIGALQLQVPAGQSEAALGMIERGRLPGGRAVANRAVCGEPSRGMIRIGRRFVILHMARGACRAGEIEVSVGMAIAALQLCVPTC